MIEYYYLDPSRNITLLVTSPVLPEDRARIASELMLLEPTAEQVGFVRGNRLDMAGGEFCGNAALSAAALYCRENGIDEGSVKMSISGVHKELTVLIRRTSENGYTGTVDMPSSLGIRTVEGFTRVDFDGISHIIVEGNMEKEKAEELAKRVCAVLGADAVGVMLLDEKESRLTPLVYVPAADTMCWENSCASGTTAVGVYLADKYGSEITADFIQPGGILRVTASPNKKPAFTGTVIIGELKKADI